MDKDSANKRAGKMLMKGQHEGKSKIITVVVVVAEDSWTRTARIRIIKQCADAAESIAVVVVVARGSEEVE